MFWKTGHQGDVVTTRGSELGERPGGTMPTPPPYYGYKTKKFTEARKADKASKTTLPFPHSPPFRPKSESESESECHVAGFLCTEARVDQAFFHKAGGQAGRLAVTLHFTTTSQSRLFIYVTNM